MGMENLYLKMVLIIRGSSLIIKSKVRGSTTTVIRLIRVIGNIMKKVGLDACYGWMATDIKAHFYMIRCTEKASFTT
jgi:hypothetical protein